MKGINKVFLFGYLGHDPEMFTSDSGAQFARFNLATNRYRKLDSGEWDTKTDWHRVTVWGKKAELIGQRLKKGEPLAVEGHIEHYQTERNGQSVQAVSIVAEDVHFVAGRTSKAAVHDELRA